MRNFFKIEFNLDEYLELKAAIATREVFYNRLMEDKSISADDREYFEGKLKLLNTVGAKVDKSYI